MGEKPIGAGKSSFDLIDELVLFAELGLAEEDSFLDLACGAGAYSLAAVRHVGPKGEIFAFDLWTEGIDQLNREIEVRQVKQIQAGVADVTKAVPLEDESVDACLVATVLHDFVELGAEQGALREVRRVVKPGGILAVVEFKVMDGPPGPPKRVRITPDQVREFVEPFDFAFVKMLDLGPYTYLSLFRRSGT